jgi:AcrR family transcriptional regulator
VAISTIARIAGVGTATLYRHFPTREDLLAAMFGEQIRHRIAILDAAVSDADPRRGFIRSLEAVVLLEIESPGIAQAIADRRSSIPVYEQFRTRAMRDLGILAQRLRDEDIVRKDFGPDDIVLMLVALGAVSVAAHTGTALPQARRLIKHLTEGVLIR